MLQQCSLSDARFPAHHEYPAAPRLRLGQEFADRFTFRPSPSRPPPFCSAWARVSPSSPRSGGCSNIVTAGFVHMNRPVRHTPAGFLPEVAPIRADQSDLSLGRSATPATATI